MIFWGWDYKGGECSAVSKVSVQLELLPLTMKDTADPKDIQGRAPVLIFSLVRFCPLDIIVCIELEPGLKSNIAARARGLHL